MVELGRNPSTNIAIYLLLLLTPSLLILGFITLQGSLKRVFARPLANISQIFSHPRVFSSIVVLLIMVWIVNLTIPNSSYASILSKDGFHFGEKIGLASAYFQSPKAFFDRDYVLIHGFGMNVLPGIVGRWFGGQDFDVAFTLYVVYWQSFLAIVFSFLILHEVAIFLAPKHQWQALLVLSLIYFALHGVVFLFIDRDTVFLLQAYLTLRWLRFSHEPIENVPQHRFKSQQIYPFLVAFLAPVSVLYVYDRAVYAIALFICTMVYLLITMSRKQLVKTLTAAIAGLIVGSLTISLIFGFQSLPNAISQIRYWSKVSGLFTALPYPRIDVSVGSLINWVPIFLQSITLTLFCLMLRAECWISRKNFKVFLAENYLPLFLLIMATFYMRVALGRSDGGHLISPGFFAVFSFIALAVRIILEWQPLPVSWQSVILTTFVAASFFNMNSVFAAINLKQLVSYPKSVHEFLTQSNTSLVDPAQASVIQGLQKELKSQSCFYTLTSEGIWYELLDKPPCSRYWYLIYAATKDAQKQLIQDLEEKKPEIILYSGGFGDVLDGIPKEASHLWVHQYIWQHYRPWRTIQNRWFWIRRETSTSLADLLVPQPNLANGYFDGIARSEQMPYVITAAGWAAFPDGLGDQSSSPNQKYPQKNVILLTLNPVGSPEQIFQINVGISTINRPDAAAYLDKSNRRQTGWSISTNQLSLPNGSFEMKAWAYNFKDYKFYQISQAQSFKIEK